MASVTESEAGQRYALHSDQECERLETQAVLAGIEGHLRHLRIPDRAHILDAGCGTGSMSRLFARRHRDATVVGVDINADYITYARRLAADEGLRNVEFKQGDLRALPFEAASFDLVWSKYVLYFVTKPSDVLSEFRRLARPGGTTVIV